MSLVARPLGVTLLGGLAFAAAAQEFQFDAAAFERKPLEWSAYLEFKSERLPFNRDGAFHKLNFYDKPSRDSIRRDTLTFKPSAKFRLGDNTTLNARAHLDVQRDGLTNAHSSRIDEGYLSYKPDPGFTLDAGKIALKWGKGYAWNPVGFVERAKDPNDPELAREGFSVLSADFIRNFDGALQTVAFTPLLIPVSRDVNSDFGAAGSMGAAGKIYMLYRDTDIDFMFQNGGGRPRRYGFDFSRNLGANLEIHGEWARVKQVTQPVVDARGITSQNRRDASSYLAGVRFISERETTYIVEYYRNGAGYSDGELSEFSRFVDAGHARYSASGDDSLLRRAASLAQGAYGRPNAGRRYAYLRVSQKEPWNILYFTPALTVIANLDDRSRSVAPELFYTGITNVELRARAIFLSGAPGSDFGEKQNSRRFELLARLYF
jgi:hypothetical protein